MDLFLDPQFMLSTCELQLVIEIYCDAIIKAPCLPCDSSTGYPTEL